MWHIELLFVANSLNKRLCEVIAVFSKWIVIASVPEVAKLLDEVIDLIAPVVSDAHWDTLAQLKTC